MTLIQVKNSFLPDNLLRSVEFYRKHPAIAASHLLVRDGKPVHLMPIQQAIIEDWFNSKFAITTASRGTGKSCRNGTKVLVPSGWTNIEDLKIGDTVITPRGTHSKVIGTYPQGKLPVFQFIFSDGRTAHCSKDHLWNVCLNKSAEWFTTNTVNIIELLGSHQVYIPTAAISPLLADRLNKFLEISVITAEKKDRCTCIKIDDPEGLFVIDDYIVTHNTFLAACFAALKLMLYPNQRIGVFAPSFRQSKLIFTEFKKFHDDSPRLRECVSKEPSMGTDQCLCIFKPAGHGISPSYIKALPIGNDGAKVRGERANILLLDEIVHLPETIYRSALKPMLSTSRNPAQRVAHIETLKKQYGGNVPPELLSTDNGYIGITSGYYQFNYWWQELVRFYQHIASGNKLYSLRFVPYTALPEGFFEMDVIKDAKANDPRHVFLTEWMAEWISDSDGVFPMSLLEACRSPTLEPKSARIPVKDKYSRYIIGIDVGREGDATGAVVGEVGQPSKVVHIEQLQDLTFQEQAKTIFRLVRAFAPQMIYMDSGGGGLVLRDLLADPKAVGFSVDDKIIPDDSSPGLRGKRILKMCAFHPEFIQDANNATKLLLEQRAIVLPCSNNPIVGLKRVRENGDKREVDLVEEMVNQIASITITKTSIKGVAHYDLPRTQALSPIQGVKVRHKDLYTSFMLMCKCLYDLEYKSSQKSEIVASGVVQELDILGDADKTGVAEVMRGRIMAPIKLEAPIYTPNEVIIPGGGIILSRNAKKNYK